MNIVNNPSERATKIYPWVYWDGWFSPEELQLITDYCEKTELEDSVVLGEEEPSKYRISKIKFFMIDPENQWFFEKMNNLITLFNDRWYNLNLDGYEHFQFTTYDAAIEGRYDWHMDTDMGSGPQTFQPRKLSLSLFLNDDYEGGDFQININGEREPLHLEKKKGRVIAFPSFLLHRVAPVVSGIRKSIVIWVVGPKFR